ncbi:MAG: hypothetical protein IAI48_08720 [Candidatus Eremiobacteraeota bacterium]|nr:hypothetical protein [Candidatus Eremiobacteraeota bacterium]
MHAGSHEPGSLSMSLLDRSLNTGGVFVLGMGSVLIIGAAFPTQLSGVTARIAAAASPITCSSTGTSSCLDVTNSSSGVAVYGTSKSGTGLRGLSTSNNGLKATSTSSYGVYGQSSTGPAAVYGTMLNKIGVLGADTGNGSGVEGTAAGTGSDTRYGYGVGVQGTGLSNGTGVDGTTIGSGTGVEGAVIGDHSPGVGVFGLSEDGPAVEAESEGSGIGVEIGSVSGTAIVAESTSGVGADITASVDGIVAHAGGLPLLLTDASDTTVFSVDGKGNVNYHGGLHSFVRTRGGDSATSFGSKSTAPTLEDTGTGHLVDGSAAVALDRIFASSIDQGSAYRVLITPDGDSRGLFVASKTPNGFVVRESQGGRSTMDFDYRVVALPLGHAAERMALAPTEPRAPFEKPARPSARTLRGVAFARP